MMDGREPLPWGTDTGVTPWRHWHAVDRYARRGTGIQARVRLRTTLPSPCRATP